MKIRKLLEMHLRQRRDGVALTSDVNVVVAANVDECGSGSVAGARSRRPDEEPEQTTGVPKGEPNA